MSENPPSLEGTECRENGYVDDKDAERRGLFGQGYAEDHGKEAVVVVKRRRESPRRSGKVKKTS